MQLDNRFGSAFDEEVAFILHGIKRNLRDHTLTTRPGSGFISPNTAHGVNGGLGAFIATVVVFLFFSAIYLMWRVYIRGKRFVPVIKHSLPVKQEVIVKQPSVFVV